MAINPERLSAAHQKLSEDPHDIDSWLLLVKHAQCRSDCGTALDLSSKVDEPKYCFKPTFLSVC